MNHIPLSFESLQNTLNSIISELPEHIYWINVNNTVLGCNDLQARASGLKNKEEAVGKNFSEFLTKEQQEVVLKNNEEVFKNGSTLIKEESLTTPDGKEHFFISKKTPLYDKDKKIIGLLGISLDITELKAAQEREKNALIQAAEKEKQLNRAVMVFSGMIAHDLRTPLATASMGGFALKKNIPTLVEAYQKASAAELDIPYILPSVLRDLEPITTNIMDSIREANAYIDASLKSLKAASQGGDLLSEEQLVLCDAERLLRRSVKDYPYKPGDDAKVHLKTEVTFNFRGNEIFFNRGLENLIKNAFEQIALKGKGEIFIETKVDDAFHHIKIKDTAGGVTPSIIEQVNQGEMKSTKEGGTGVGLSSVKHMMEALGGKMEAQLVDGDYIEFVLSFPRVEQ